MYRNFKVGGVEILPRLPDGQGSFLPQNDMQKKVILNVAKRSEESNLSLLQ